MHKDIFISHTWQKDGIINMYLNSLIYFDITIDNYEVNTNTVLK